MLATETLHPVRSIINALYCYPEIALTKLLKRSEILICDLFMIYEMLPRFHYHKSKI